MSPTDPSRVPVVVCVAQVTEKEAIVDAIGLAEQAAQKALGGAERLRNSVDRLTLVAISFSHSVPDAPRVLVDRLGLPNATPEHSSHGGNIPQLLVNRAAEDIAAGTLRSALIVGAEATRSMRDADPAVNFMKVAATNIEIEKTGTTIGPTVTGIMGEAERRGRLLVPVVVYPMFESVLAKRAGRSHSEQRAAIAPLMSRFTEVAAKNPYAWLNKAQSPEQIAGVTESNRLISEPYTRSMNSFPNVDQSAALLVTNLAAATAAGLADQCVFPWGGAEASELRPAQRPDLGASPAMNLAADTALTGAGLSIDEIAHIDFYSCFPVAVEVAAAGLGVDPAGDRDLTVTGGLPYFGGPGNNYSTHAIASMVERIRESGEKGFVSANGGFMSKHAAGVYAATPPAGGFRRLDTAPEQKAIVEAARPVTLEASGVATVDAATVTYGRNGEVSGAPIIATLDDGRRVVARAAAEALGALGDRNLVGEKVSVSGSPVEYRPA